MSEQYRCSECGHFVEIQDDAMCDVCNIGKMQHLRYIRGGDKEEQTGGEMRRFYLHRIEDESGVSGTGYVAEGVCFTNGKCAISWTTKYTSIAIYDSIKDLDAIHSHNGKTIIEWEEK